MSTNTDRPRAPRLSRRWNWQAHAPILGARLLAATSLLGLTALVSNQAYAGLLGVGNTVQVFYYNSVFANPEGEIAVGSSTTDPFSLASPVDYTQGAADGSTIHIGDTQIAIKNLLSNAPFCLLGTPGTACVDVIDRFDFKFTGEDILGVTVDPGSAADFLPVTGTFQGNTHLGLQLISPDEIRVDVTGDLPAVNDQLLLDLSFTSTTPPAVPEPHTLPLLCAALGLGLLVRKAVLRQRSST